MDRRAFLTRAALGGATIIGASALGALDADAAFAAPPESLDPAVGNPAFVEGRVTARNGNLLTLAGSYGDSHRVQLTRGTSVWKLEPTDTDAVEVGDGMYARGVPMPDGTVAADAVWVNIVNLVGDLHAIGRDRIQLRHRGHTIVGRLVTDKTVVSLAGAAPIGDLSRLRIGQRAGLLGAWRPDDDTVDVARITVGR